MRRRHFAKRLRLQVLALCSLDHNEMVATPRTRFPAIFSIQSLVPAAEADVLYVAQGASRHEWRPVGPRGSSDRLLRIPDSEGLRPDFPCRSEEPRDTMRRH
jgi:hypothetical protein